MLRLLITMSLFYGLMMQAYADDQSVKKLLETQYPRWNIESVSKTPYAGLYEVFANKEIFYTDEGLSFLIAEGHILEPKTNKDITGERLEWLTRIDFSSLPLEYALKTVKGNGSRKLAVFSDPDCVYCKALEKNALTHINDVTIYTFLYPIDQTHPNAAKKIQAIWCASNPVKAWVNWMHFSELATPKENCTAPTDKVRALAQKLGIDSTPTLILGNGRRMVGAQPRTRIENALAEITK